MDREYWTKALNEAERELEAATTRTALNAAAKKLMRARQQLKLLEQAGSSRRRSSRARASGAWTPAPRSKKPKIDRPRF
jgi:hypothetical protein